MIIAKRGKDEKAVSFIVCSVFMRFKYYTFLMRKTLQIFFVSDALKGKVKFSALYLP